MFDARCMDVHCGDVYLLVVMMPVAHGAGCLRCWLFMVLLSIVLLSILADVNGVGIHLIICCSSI
jgi:hypothetical protein